MAQYDFGTIDPNTKSGTELATDLNSWRNAVHSTHSAATAPSYLVAGMLWADTTSANYELKMYDGAQWITVAVLDATNNVARVAVDPAETSYITSTTSGQIRHLIASADIFTIRSTGVQFNIASPVIADSSNNELISFTTTASAVNQIGIANAATGGAPTISAVGGDTNINIALTPKGTGVTQAITETAATNTIIDVARIEARSSGTPAAGIGAGLLFAAETAANNFEIGARIEAVATDVTAASEDFDLVFKTMAAGAAAVEVMRLTSNADVAIGGTVSAAWDSAYNVITLATGAAWSAKSNSPFGYRLNLQTNSEIQASNPVRISDGFVSSYWQQNGRHYFDTAPNGLAGSVIASSTVLYLGEQQQVGIKTVSPTTELHVAGALLTEGVTYLYQPAQTTKAAAATLTIAELLTGIIQYTGAASTQTLPTGTSMQTGLPVGIPVNTSFDFSVINTGTGTATLGTATGLTLVGSMAVAIGTSGRFRARNTGTNTFTIYRI